MDRGLPENRLLRDSFLSEGLRSEVWERESRSHLLECKRRSEMALLFYEKGKMQMFKAFFIEFRSKLDMYKKFANVYI